MNATHQVRRFSIKSNSAFAGIEVGNFNKTFPIGTRVTVRLNSGVPFETTIAGKAWSDDRRGFVRVKGFLRAWPLNRIKQGWEEL